MRIQVVIPLIFTCLFSLLPVSGMAQTKGTCKEEKESAFFRLMTDKFTKFVFQTGIKNLPYNVKNVIDLMKATCVTVSDERLSIDTDEEFKDAVNYYPARKHIVLYRPVWDRYRSKYLLGDWKMADYYQLFRIIHHEIVPYFIKKSDPQYKTSLVLYEYMTPYVSPEEFSGDWIYTQKFSSPGFYPYMGDNCAITIKVDDYDKKRSAEEIENDATRNFKSFSMSITLGIQNPNSSLECPRLFDLERVTPAKLEYHYGYHFLVFCDTNDNDFDFQLLDSLPKDFRTFPGEFMKYKPFRCKSSDHLERHIDKNLGGVIDLTVDLLPNREIKLNFNFHRKSLQEKIFSFSNVYKPLQPVDPAFRNMGSYNKRHQKTPEYMSKINAYPIQKWVYANKLPTSEENCNEAKKWIEPYVSEACDLWVKYFGRSRFDEDLDFLVEDILLGFVKDRKRLYCSPESYKMYQIQTKGDNGCIIVGEKHVMKK